MSLPSSANGNRSPTRLAPGLPSLAQFSPEELALARLAATGLRDEAISEHVNTTLAAARVAVVRLYSKFGANRDIDRYLPRVMLALQYWRLVGQLREGDEMCCCPHVHTGNGNGRH